MNDQLELFDVQKPAPARYGVFLAVLPDLATALRIADDAARLREDHGLSGNLRPVSHLHVTLHYLGAKVEVPRAWLDLVRAAAANVAARVPCFEIHFDRVLSFKGRNSDKPVVLGHDATANAPLRELHRLLGKSLTSGGLRLERSASFTPHVTLFYDQRTVREMPMEPVRWVVREVVLLQSELGEMKYETLGRWPLLE